MSKKNPRYGYFLVVPRNPRDPEIGAMMRTRLRELHCHGPRFGFDNDPTGAFVIRGAEDVIRSVIGNGRRAAMYSDQDSRRLEALKEQRPELELLIGVLTAAKASDEHEAEFMAEQRRKHHVGVIRVPDRNRPLRGAA